MKRSQFRIAFALLVAAWLAACAPRSPLNFPISETETAAGAGGLAGAGENDACRNPYWPIVQGAEWTYQSAENGPAVHRMSASDDGSFSLTVEGGTSTFVLNGRCDDGSIVLMDVPGISGSASGSGGGAQMTTKYLEGETLPDDIQIGDDWSQSMSLVVTSGDYAMDAVIETTYQAIGYETVTVPAGTFHALKIEQTAMLTMNGNDSLASHGFLWYAQGVGNVKTVIEDVDTLELVAYSIP